MQERLIVGEYAGLLPSMKAMEAARRELPDQSWEWIILRALELDTQEQDGRFGFKPAEFLVSCRISR